MPTISTTQKLLDAQLDAIAALPKHLQPFVAHQDYSKYTPRDQAIWRFLLNQLSQNLASSAHSTYSEGLRRTGISINEIPRIEVINAHLEKIGWNAVVVNGFLPPAIFMEFQALKVLAIAVDIRSFEHMLYTPAPDIVHEAAGHAPFLIDIDYAEFLQRFGELGMYAIANQADMEIYEAIRSLSILKETVTSTDQELKQAEQRLNNALKSKHSTSEAALLARLHWWTVEYGLVGNTTDYKIFGAGLLSSLGESISCLNDKKVEKLALTVNAIDTDYDITQTQPQLFVTDSCRHLSHILEEFGRKMAHQLGGPAALTKALNAGTVCTVRLNSGLEIAGKVSAIREDAVGNIIYFNTQHATQLAFEGTELEGQGIAQHPNGFSSPLGRLIGFERCLSNYSVDELKRHKIAIETHITLRYLSGITVNGLLRTITRKRQRNILFTFEECTVTDFEGNILYDPSWGVFDMAVGDSVVSVKGGSADQNSYPLYSAPSNKVTAEQDYDLSAKQQFTLYQRIRNIRESDRSSKAEIEQLLEEIQALEVLDWLLIYEALELAQSKNFTSTIQTKLYTRLERLEKKASQHEQTLIKYALTRLNNTRFS